MQFARIGFENHYGDLAHLAESLFLILLAPGVFNINVPFHGPDVVLGNQSVNYNLVFIILILISFACFRYLLLNTEKVKINKSACVLCRVVE